MKPVYQEIIDGKNGDCLRAAVASLFELNLHDVPHFIEQESWIQSFLNFVNEKGYEYSCTLYNPRVLGAWGTDRFEEIKEEKGVKGYFVAVVYSPKYFELDQLGFGKREKTHAVIIDKDLRIVHDPNPNYQDVFDYPLYDRIEHHGIINIYVINEK